MTMAPPLAHFVGACLQAIRENRLQAGSYTKQDCA